VLGLLLTTRVNAREVVTGRLAGKLTQLAMIVLAGLPYLVFNASLAGFGVGTLAVAIILPLAVAFGAAGMALLASVTSRRGLAALITVYLLLVVFLLAPLVRGHGLPGWLDEAALWLNPYAALGSLAWADNRNASLNTIALWLTMGLAGAGLASWRLRPVSMARAGGSARRLSRLGRRRPPVSDKHPMVWKAIHVEAVGSLGWFGRLLGILLLAWLAGSTTLFAAIAIWTRWVRPDTGWEGWALDGLRTWVGAGASWASILVQWALGIQVAMAVAGERERGTWDAILCSMLEGREIVLGMLCGSLFALRWLVASALWAWTWALALGVLPAPNYVSLLLGLATTGVLMTAVGMRASLAVSSATRAAAITVGVWLGAYLAIGLATLLVMMVLAFVALIVYWSGYYIFQSIGAQAAFAYWTALSVRWLSFGTFYASVHAVLTLVVAAFVIGDLMLRFDRLAGRIPGGEFTLKVEQILRGAPVTTMPGAPPAPKPASPEAGEPVVLEPVADEPAARGV
jgi:hypothetical protein